MLANAKHKFGDFYGRLRIWCALAPALLLFACGDYGCIEPDDWGYPKISLIMDYQDMMRNNEIVTIPGNDYVQYMNPKNTNRLLLGTDLKIRLDRVHNQWAPFLGPALNPMFDEEHVDRLVEGWWPEKLIPNRECRYFRFNPAVDYTHLDEFYYDNTYDFDQEVIALQKQQLTNCERNLTDGDEFIDSDFYGDCLAPCFVRHGVGLYMGLFPNATTLSDVPSMNKNDITIRHLTDFDLSGPLNYDTDGNSDPRDLDNYLVNGTFEGVERNARLYFKIADTYYEDNTGGYVVHVKCGTKPDKKGPFLYITDLIKAFALSIAEALYTVMVSSSEFVTVVKAVLVLYVIFFGYGYIMGTLQADRKTFFFRIFKFGLIMALISEGSWEFFYIHFFAFFTEGIDFLSGLFLEGVKDLGLGCNWLGEESPWYAADVMFDVLTSDETWRKVASTLFSNPTTGWIFIIVFIVAFIIFIIAAVKMLFMYMVAFASLAMLIIVFPIFLLLYLFGWTKSFFEKEWISQAVANVSEVVFSVALLGFIFQIIMMMLQGTLGYRVCWKVFLDIPQKPVFFSLSFFMPEIGNEMEMVDTDGDSTLDDLRYRDLPYLDPDIEQEKIDRYLKNQNFIDIGDTLALLGIMVVFLYLSELFNKISDEIKSGGNFFKDSASIATSGASPTTILKDFKAVTPVPVIPTKTRPGGLFVSPVKRVTSIGKYLYNSGKKKDDDDD